MVRAQKNQFKKGKNVLFTLLSEQCLVQTIEETDLNTRSNRTFFAALQGLPFVEVWAPGSPGR